MSLIREFIERGMNEHGDGQLTSNHQPSDEYCSDIQDFHDDSLHDQHQRLNDGYFLLRRKSLNDYHVKRHRLQPGASARAHIDQLFIALALDLLPARRVPCQGTFG